MKHSKDCIYHPGHEAAPPKPGAKVPCCKSGASYMARRSWRRERDQILRDCGLVAMVEAWALAGLPEPVETAATGWGE